METQVQQKVTGKSIQIELISPSLSLAPFSFHKGYKARFHTESHFNYCRADAALITTNTMIFFSFSFPLNDKREL